MEEDKGPFRRVFTGPTGVGAFLVLDSVPNDGLEPLRFRG